MPGPLTKARPRWGGALSTALSLGALLGALGVAWSPTDQPLRGLTDTAQAAEAEGVLCGDPRIRGVRLEGFDEGGGCGIDAPVSVARFGDVAMSPVAVLGCPMARLLADWVEEGLTPAARQTLDAQPVQLVHVSAYVCRRRNNQPGAKLSFHAKGAALDIAAIEFSDGRRAALSSEDWSGEGPLGAPGGAFWRALWRSACGPFGTVLGPDADAQHKDHLHIDAAERRSAYCR